MAFLALSPCLLSAWPISQPPQPQSSPRAMNPWVCWTLPTQALTQLRLRQGRQQALVPKAESETRPALRLEISGQNMWLFNRNSEKSYSLHYSTASGTAFMETKLLYASKRLLVVLDCSVWKSNITSSQEESFVIVCSCWRIKRN